MNQAQILDEGVCVSLHPNTFMKGMNPLFLPPGQTGLLNFRRKKSELKTQGESVTIFSIISSYKKNS